VETTPATTADGEVTPKGHQALQQRDLLPAVHIVDTGFLDAELLVASREDYGVDLLVPRATTSAGRLGERKASAWLVSP
jgi:transposase